MEKKDLRRLSRVELIELLLAESREIEELNTELEQTKMQLAKAKAKLKDREIRIQNAGSIAEAALSLSGVFEAAQRAADDYLAQIHKMGSEVAVPADEGLLAADGQKLEIGEEAGDTSDGRILQREYEPEEGMTTDGEDAGEE